jgi:nucleoside-diphosphate-sugar epimerase
VASDISSPVLVTGASGFIGAHVVIELLKRGIKTRAMMRDVSLKTILPQDEKLEIVYGDLFDVDSLKKAVKGCENVIHCAANLLVGKLDPQTDVIDTSVIGVENLCSVMGNVKNIIHTSSVAAIRPTNYENGKTYSVADWCNDASLEKNPYGFAKAEGEKSIRNWAEGKNVRLITIHPSIVFGPILHPKHAEGSMSYLKHFVKGPPFVLDVNLNFVDVRDVALAHVNALEKGKDRKRFLTHTNNMWMKEIGQILKTKKGGKWATRKLPKLLAYFFAIFHPKLSIKQLRGSLGAKVSYDVEDTWNILGINTHSPEDSIIDGVESIQQFT